MTKSEGLVIADDTEHAVMRHPQGEFETFEDVTAKSRKHLHKIAHRPPSEGLNPSPEFQLDQAIKTAATALFDNFV